MIAYAITDPTTLNFQILTKEIEEFSKKSNMIVYRDKSTKLYNSNAELFLEEARKYNFFKVLLHSNYILAKELNADGIHLKSTQFDEIEKAKALGLFVIISTHTLREAQKAENLGADMITFSPIFSTPNKGEAKGVKKLKEIISLLAIPVIALGGIITQEQINLCEENGAKGFASIRFFINNPTI